MPRRRFARSYQEETTVPAVQQMVAPEKSRGQQPPVLGLQNMIGNKALQRMLIQRELELDELEVTVDGHENSETDSENPVMIDEMTVPVGETEGVVHDGPLTPAQVTKAISYYETRKRDYPPHIIEQIQEALGSTKTGKADDFMVQSVANYQFAFGLAVDGMAGPRTLPAIFAQGLDTSEHEEDFSDFAVEQLNQWESLGSADARAEQLMDKINELLEASKVPECGFKVKDLPDLLGQFDFTPWIIELGKPAFERDVITLEEYSDAANTVYHEARHAEQWFSMARMLAGQGKSAAQIATMMGIPVTIATEAVSVKYAPTSMEALVANGWYQSVYGVDAQKRENTFREMEAAGKEVEAAEKALEKADTPVNKKRLQRAQERHQRAYDAYHNLPEETDAHRVGDSVEARIRLKAELENMP
ncbi:MAG: peptidoglycan-binding protein [Anaerolineae bacterium]|nr:peptidoglycan-binding protein [Anaerolineae bacterium]